MPLPRRQFGQTFLPGTTPTAGWRAAPATCAGLADLRQVLRNIVLFSLVSELVLAVVRTARFAVVYDYLLGRVIGKLRGLPPDRPG
jgi:hypothetical protein